ncbi:MAG: hypothetical protein ACE5F5_03165 [Acidimicrobiia bacterium]
MHCSAPSYPATDWHQIVTLYNHLYRLMPTSMVALNRTIAIGEAHGPDAALVALDAIAGDLDAYHLMHAARASMLRRLGQKDAARDAYERAIDLAPTETEQRFLTGQIEELSAEVAGDRWSLRLSRNWREQTFD